MKLQDALKFKFNSGECVNRLLRLRQIVWVWGSRLRLLGSSGLLEQRVRICLSVSKESRNDSVVT